MICHKKYLLFKESYNVELHSDKVILQNVLYYNKFIRLKPRLPIN